MRAITASWVMAAMIRSEPRRQNGQVAISRSNTRLSSRAQRQHGMDAHLGQGDTALFEFGDLRLRVAEFVQHRDTTTA